MRLLFHSSGSQDCPLIVITDLGEGDVLNLQRMVAALARGNEVCGDVDVDSAVVGDIRLRLEVTDHDIGVVGTEPNFRCCLTATTWHGIEGLLEPFTATDCGGHQWLDGSGDIALLISPSGWW